MKSSTLLLAIASALLPASLATPAVQMPNVVDWAAQQVSQIGEGASSSEVQAASGWQFIDCGEFVVNSKHCLVSRASS